jgi:hypothetical protein
MVKDWYSRQSIPKVAKAAVLEPNLPGTCCLATAGGALKKDSTWPSTVYFSFPRSSSNLIINLRMQQCQQHRVFNGSLLLIIPCTTEIG